MEPMDRRVVVPLTAGMLERLTEVANRNQWTLAETMRRALASCLEADGRAARPRDDRPLENADTSDEEVGHAPPAEPYTSRPPSPGRAEPAKLARARAVHEAAIQQVTSGRYETRELPSGKVLQVPVRADQPDEDGGYVAEGEVDDNGGDYNWSE